MRTGDACGRSVREGFEPSAWHSSTWLRTHWFKNASRQLVLQDEIHLGPSPGGVGAESAGLINQSLHF